MLSTPLQLNGYELTHFSVHAREEFDGRKGYACSVAVDPTHLVNRENPGVHQLILRVEVCASAEDPAGAPYDIEIEGRAIVQVAEDSGLDDNQLRKLVVLNGSSILLGILRGHVSQLTASGPAGMFLLPAVNLVEVFQEKYARSERESGESLVASEESVKPAVSSQAETSDE